MSLLKPTAKTPFHIDFEWWEHNDRDWRVFLRTLLCAEHQESLADMAEDARIDWIDPRTAEVKQVDGIQHTLMHHCALAAGVRQRADHGGGGRLPADAGQRQ